MNCSFSLGTPKCYLSNLRRKIKIKEGAKRSCLGETKMALVLVTLPLIFFFFVLFPFFPRLIWIVVPLFFCFVLFLFFFFCFFFCFCFCFCFCFLNSLFFRTIFYFLTHKNLFGNLKQVGKKKIVLISQ